MNTKIMKLPEKANLSVAGDLKEAEEFTIANTFSGDGINLDTFFGEQKKKINRIIESEEEIELEGVEASILKSIEYQGSIRKLLSIIQEHGVDFGDDERLDLLEACALGCASRDQKNYFES